MGRIKELLDAASDVEESFEGVLKLRGKARAPAIATWFSENPEHAFAMTYGMLNHKSKSRKELGKAQLTTLDFEANREALGELCAELLQGSKYSLYPIAIGMLRAHPGLVADSFDTLAAFVQKTHETSLALDALTLIDEATTTHEELTQDQALAIYDKAIDHWATSVRERAEELIVERGGSPRTSMWQDCPLSEDVRRQIARLGGTISGAPDPDAPRPISSWEGSLPDDSQNDLTEIPWPIAYFDKHVRLPHGLDDFDRDFERSYGSGSGLCYAHSENGQDLLLLDIMYEDMGQWFVTLDLTDTSDDPRARGWDHEGWDRGRLGSLSRFLGTLKTP